jgi:hypothetical protein
MNKQAKPVNLATVKPATITRTAIFDSVYSQQFAQAVGRFFKAEGRFYIVVGFTSEPAVAKSPETIGNRDAKFVVELRPIDKSELGGKPSVYKRVYGLKNQLLDLIDSADSANK